MGSWAEPKKKREREKRLSTESGVDIFFLFSVCVCGKTNSKSIGIIIIVPWMRERETFSSCKKRRVCVCGARVRIIPHDRVHRNTNIKSIWSVWFSYTLYCYSCSIFLLLLFLWPSCLSLSLFTKSTQSPSIKTYTHTHTHTQKDWMNLLSQTCRLTADWIGSIHDTKADRQQLLDRFRSGKRIQIRRGKFVCSRGGMAGIVMMMTRKKK